MYLREPSRGGSRGGKDQFTWKNVESDKYRENYLANSLMAPVGRWQKGKDLTWYTKDSKALGKKERLRMEREAIKRAEADAMTRALGLKPEAIYKPVEKLSKEEIAGICKRRDEVDSEGVLQEKVMKGVGFKSSRNLLLIDSTAPSLSKDATTKFEIEDSETKKADKLVFKGDISRKSSSESKLLERPTTQVSEIKEGVPPEMEPGTRKRKHHKSHKHDRKIKKRKRREHRDHSAKKHTKRTQK